MFLVIVGPFLLPIPPLTDTTSAETLADEALVGERSQFVDLPLGDNTLKVHIERAGSGETTLILLHGYLSSTFSWHEVIEPLAAQHTVIAFDRPAFGLTQRPMRESWGSRTDWNTLNPYSIDAQIQLTINLMDKLGIDKAVLVGNSAGGNIAMRTALAHPERVQGLILLDPAVYNSNNSRTWTSWFINTPQAQRLGPYFTRRIVSWGIDFGQAAWHDPSKLTDEIWVGYKLPLRTENWDRALWEMTNAPRPADLVERVSEINTPALVITGDDDRIVPTEQSIRLSGELPNAELFVVEACGHVPHEECPAPVLVAIGDFIDKLVK